MSAPLAGRRLLVTRPRRASLRWARALEARGAETVVLPCVRIEPLVSQRDRERLAAAIGGAAVVAFTSAQAVRIVAGCTGAAAFSAVRVAVVGPATAAAARQALGRADLVAPSPDGASLGAALAAAAPRGRPVLLLGSRRGLRDTDERLASAGVPWRRIDVYEGRPARPRARRHNLSALGVDTVIVASPSAVIGLVGLAVVPAGTPVVALGPTTGRAVTGAGLGDPSVARTPDLDGIVEALE